jgi:uroporphyrinogen-III synthase
LARVRVVGIEQPAAGFRAESLVEQLKDQVAGRRVLVIRGERGRDVLAEGLRARGADVEELMVYRSLDIQAWEPEVERVLRTQRSAWILATSPASARCLVSLVRNLSPEDPHGVARWKWVSISRLTSDALRECGVENIREASEATSQAMVDTVLRDAREGHLESESDRPSVG